MVHGKQQDIQQFIVFGSRTFVCIPAKLRKEKIEAKSTKRSLVMYCRGNAYLILLDNSNKVMETKDATYFEEKESTNKTMTIYIEFEMDDEEMSLYGVEQDNINETDIDEIDESKEANLQIKDIGDEENIKIETNNAQQNEIMMKQSQIVGHRRRRNAEKASTAFGFEEVLLSLTPQPENRKDIPISHSDAVSEDDVL